MGSAHTVAGERDDHLVSNSVLAGQLPPLLPVFPLHLVALYNPKQVSAMFEQFISIINILPPQFVDIFSIVVPELYKPQHVSGMLQNAINLLHI